MEGKWKERVLGMFDSEKISIMDQIRLLNDSFKWKMMEDNQ
jgi:hypothetical protein